MKLKDFIKKYSLGGHRGPYQYLFECELEKDGGFIIPDGFFLLNDISKIPLFIIAVNREERAIIKFDGELSLSIYDSEVGMDSVISRHREYFISRYESYLNLRSFCEEIKHLEVLEVMDAISSELHEIDKIDESSKKKDIYRKDLMGLLRLFTSTTFPKEKARADFIKDAYPLLIKLENHLFSVQSMNLVKISNVYYTKTDETYYVLKEQYEEAYKYISDNIEQTKEQLADDGWRYTGKVTRWDNVLVETYSKNNKIIALWDDVITK